MRHSFQASEIYFLSTGVILGLGGFFTTYISVFNLTPFIFSALSGLLIFNYFTLRNSANLQEWSIIFGFSIIIFYPYLINLYLINKIFISWLDIFDILWKILAVNLFIQINKTRNKDVLFKAIYIGVWVAAIYSFLRGIHIRLDHWNHFPIYLGILLPIIFKKKLLPFAIIGSVIVFWFIFQSRAAFLGLLLGSLPFISPIFRNPFAKVTSLFTAFTCVFFLAYIDRGVGFYGLSSGRGELWWFWIETLLNVDLHLWTGLGSTANPIWDNYVSKYNGAILDPGILKTFHSSWILLFVNKGLLGLVAFLLLINACLKRNYHGRQDATYSDYLYYFMLAILTFNSSVSIPGPSLEALMFLLSVFVVLPFKKSH